MSAESDLYKNLLDQLQACATQEERDWLALRFTLEQLPEPLRAAVQAAAVPRFFDRAFLNALLDQPLDEAQFAELTGLSYIEPYPGEGRFNVHERSRKLLQEKLWQEDEALYREISRRAFAYCKKQDQNVLTWRIETVYHQLVAEPEKGADTLNNTCLGWEKPPYFSYNKAERLLLAVQEHQNMHRLSERIKCYFWLNQARVALRYARLHEAKEILQDQLLFEFNDLYLTEERLVALGDTHLYLSELIEAQSNYTKILLLTRKTNHRSTAARCLMMLGDVYWRHAEYKKARQKYTAGLVLYHEINNRLGEANCLYSLGNVHLALSELPLARQQYEKALKLHREIDNRRGEANCLQALGEVNLRLSELPSARQRYKEAMTLYREIGDRLGEANCLSSLGDVHLRLSEFPDAGKRFTEALQRYQDINEPVGEADSLRMFGRLSVRTGDFAASQKYFEQASAQFERIEGWEGVAECLEGFAELYQAQQQLPQAEEYWHKAADRYRQLSMPLRAEYCLEQLRQMKEQKQPAYVRHEVSDKQTPPADE